MPEEIINLPYFEIKNDSIFYLGQYEYLSLKKSSLSGKLKKKILADEGVVVHKKAIQNVNITKKILVVEPHPDDFALSASGYALEGLAEGASLSILNLFSRTSITNFPWFEKIVISETQYEELRLQESKIAIEEYLGSKFNSLKLSLASVRGNNRTFSKKHSEDELVDQIALALIKKISTEKIDVVLCPMAIQGHIDHLVAFAATIKAYRQIKQKIDLIFYEDMPYARNKSVYAKRIKQLKLSMDLEKFYIPTEPYLETIADLIIIYRSQFDDIKRTQMLAIIKEDFRATANDYNSKNIKKVEFAQRYHKLKGLK